MNYRHIYHAGNFADVLKHATLALVLEHLKLKKAPFAVLDTHAGTGLYDLASTEAQKTQEWRGGIGRLMGPDAVPIPAEVAKLLAPFLDAVRAENPDGVLARYPGSPMLARALIRPQDRLTLCELHSADAALLAELFERDKQVTVEHMDGWAALKAKLPPQQRRGLVLIDPPFEEKDEIEQILRGLEAALRRFATGTFMIWYPIKDVKTIARFHARLAGMGLPKCLIAELLLRRPSDKDRLNGSGLVILNPPFTLPERLRTLLAWFASVMGEAGAGSFRIDWIKGEEKTGA